MQCKSNLDPLIPLVEENIISRKCDDIRDPVNENQHLKYENIGP